MPPRKRQIDEIKSLAEPHFSKIQKENFTKALHHFNNGKYFEAHEYWEEVWLDMGDKTEDDGEIILRALIQFAAALHCFNTKRISCTYRHLKKSQLKFSLLKSNYLGIDFKKIKSDISNNYDHPDRLNGYQIISGKF